MASLCPKLVFAQHTFVDSDGARDCSAKHLATGQYVTARGVNDPNINYIAYSGHDPAGYPVIVFNTTRMNQLPLSFRRLTFYHECSHLRIPSSDELRVNCAALRIMRAQGESSPQIEEEIRVASVWIDHTWPVGGQYGGSAATFWQSTVQCVEAGTH